MSDRGVGSAWLVPGLPALVRGRWGAGLAALLPWAACLAVLVLRWDRVAAVSLAGPDGALALITLLAGIAAPWVWAYREAAGGGAGTGGTEPSGGADRVREVRAFAANRAAVVGSLLLGGILLATLLAPLLAPADPVVQGPLLTERLAPPSAAHPFGTDRLARDVLSRVLYGARMTLGIAVLAVAIGVIVGVAVGAVAAYAGGWVETVFMRTVDVVLAFPRLVLLIAVVALFEPSVTVVVLVLGFTQWPGIARMVHGEVLSVKEREHVLAARALGYRRTRILLRHVLPNALTPVIVAAALGVGSTIVAEAGLSYLSLGPPPPAPSWGAMVESGQDVLMTAWWLSFFPGLAIVVTVLAVNLVGDGLRDALDPRLGGDA